MTRELKKRDFMIKDLVVSVAGGNHGSTWLPGPDQETPPSPISPIASVLVNMGLIETVRATVREALKGEEGIEAIGQAFSHDGAHGNPVIRKAIFDIGAAVVGSTAFAAMGDGKLGMPNPECGGTSLETIPTPITPVVLTGWDVHRLTELPRLKKQLTVAMDFMAKAAETQMPVGAEEDLVRKHLKGALENMG